MKKKKRRENIYDFLLKLIESLGKKKKTILDILDIIILLFNILWVKLAFEKVYAG